jgi:hypothetical protein
VALRKENDAAECREVLRKAAPCDRQSASGDEFGGDRCNHLDELHSGEAVPFFVTAQPEHPDPSRLSQ